MIETDPHEQRRRSELGELARLHLDLMRRVDGRRQAQDAHAVAADGLHERLQVGRRRDDRERAAATGGSGRQQEQRKGEHCKEWSGLSPSYFLATNTLFGTMQCTPLRTSTTWLTRQSATMEVSE